MKKGEERLEPEASKSKKKISKKKNSKEAVQEVDLTGPKETNLETDLLEGVFNIDNEEEDALSENDIKKLTKHYSVLKKCKDQDFYVASEYDDLKCKLLDCISELNLYKDIDDDDEKLRRIESFLSAR